jgi:outer membrane receptor protein involved in Fe transport
MGTNAVAWRNAVLRLYLASFGLLSAMLSFLAAGQEPAEPAIPGNAAAAQELPTVVVIGNAPLPGLGLPPNVVPANVQSANSSEMRRQQTLGVPDFLNDNFSGVSVSEAQSNPLQLDVNYHGFTASPLLGTPQGISVYVDGVRVNESFGDTVNWDLIPEPAISTVVLAPGSNPVFGLNTLGGALSLQTKSGHDNSGTELEVSGGSFRRAAEQASTGGAHGALDWFLAGCNLDQYGWRDLSSTHARQLFGKVGWQTERVDLDLSYTWADNNLTGNGAVPESMLDYRYQSIFTAPDFAHNHLDFINLVGSRFLTGQLLISGNAYYRNLRTDSNSGDLNDDNYLSADYQGPMIDCSVPATSQADSAWCSNGVNRVARLQQETEGARWQVTDTTRLLAGRNQLLVGGDYSHARNTYQQELAYATLAPNRTAVTDVNPFNPDQIVNSVSGINDIWGVYFTDTWSPADVFHMTVSARYNHSHETLNGYSVNVDVGDFGHGFGGAHVLAGDHAFTRLNPAIGFTVTPAANLTTYANYSESNRAPTVIELGCANPQVPCGLPNSFASDPDMKQVVSRSLEVGVRGDLAERALHWSVDVFRTINDDDIQFIATNTSQGYFANVGKTRRQGFDLAIDGASKQLSWRAAYSLVEASFQSTFAVNGESNSTADTSGSIQVDPGDRMPLIPRNVGRLTLDYKRTRLDMGASLIVVSSSFLHGNENNGNQAGGVNAQDTKIDGSGRIGGYAVVNLFSTAVVSGHIDVFCRLENLFNRKYSTAGFLATNAFEPNGAFRPDPGDWTHGNSVSPGAPRGAWAGVRVHWK